MRVGRMSGVVAVALGLGLVAGPSGARAAEELPPLITTLETLTDPTGDVFNTATGEVVDNPRADITAASLEYAPGWIRMKVQVKNLTDPLRDPAWSDRSDAEWVLDTTGDGQANYTVEFATDQGELYGAVFDVAKPDDKSVCDADSASFSAGDGYTLVIDPACIGNPRRLGYAVAVFIDTNPAEDNAPLATDRVPDEGFKAVAAPVQPGETPAPGDTPAAPTAPAGAPPADPGPSAPRPDADPAAPRAAASAPTTAAPDRAPASEAAGTPAAPAPAAPLARTGAASSRHALFGLGIMLLGAGLLVMTRPNRRGLPAGLIS